MPVDWWERGREAATARLLQGSSVDNEQLTYKDPLCTAYVPVDYNPLAKGLPEAGLYNTILEPPVKTSHRGVEPMRTNWGNPLFRHDEDCEASRMSLDTLRGPQLLWQAPEPQTAGPDRPNIPLVFLPGENSAAPPPFPVFVKPDVPKDSPGYHLINLETKTNTLFCCIPHPTHWTQPTCDHCVLASPSTSPSTTTSTSSSTPTRTPTITRLTHCRSLCHFHAYYAATGAALAEFEQRALRLLEHGGTLLSIEDMLEFVGGMRDKFRCVGQEVSPEPIVGGEKLAPIAAEIKAGPIGVGTVLRRGEGAELEEEDKDKDKDEDKDEDKEDDKKEDEDKEEEEENKKEEQNKKEEDKDKEDEDKEDEEKDENEEDEDEEDEDKEDEDEEDEDKEDEDEEDEDKEDEDKEEKKEEEQEEKEEEEKKENKKLGPWWDRWMKRRREPASSNWRQEVRELQRKTGVKLSIPGDPPPT
ncbi:hypothetical protein B0T19DRAFT_459320 [Cercophora scortea]|uniref:Uncharacterized protein n=1 Tax=Cercophora scortea TaxID=314031 RepID=A0AAE0IZ53_9PEZI|nr:hypothetical protein B0T19DRAFT_459320 [Cercophora scortea]